MMVWVTSGGDRIPHHQLLPASLLNQYQHHSSRSHHRDYTISAYYPYHVLWTILVISSGVLPFLLVKYNSHLAHCDHCQLPGSHFCQRGYKISASYPHHDFLPASVILSGTLPFSLVPQNSQVLPASHWNHYQHHGGHFCHKEYRIPASYPCHVLLTALMILPGTLPFSLVKQSSHQAFLGQENVTVIYHEHRGEESGIVNK